MVFNFERKEEDCFSDENIEVTLGLYYYAKFNRKVMKIYNEEYKDEKKNDVDFIVDQKFSGIKNDIIKFLRDHFNKFNVNDNLNKYLTNMDNICKEAEANAKEKVKISKKARKNEIQLDEDKEEEEEEEDEKDEKKKSSSKKSAQKGKQKGKGKNVASKKKLLGKKRKKAK